MSEGNDTAAWAKAHEACYETEPIMEIRDSVKVQAGFVLSLYARLPMEVPAGEDRRAAGGAIWERLHAILTEAMADEGAENVTLDIEPLRTAAVLRPSNKLQPEIALRASIRHKEAFQAVNADERQQMSAFEKKLATAGLRAGHW